MTFSWIAQSGIPSSRGLNFRPSAPPEPKVPPQTAVCRSRILISALSIVAALFVSPAAEAQQRKTVIGEIGNIIGDIVREAVGERRIRQAVVEDAVMAVPANNVKPAKSEIDKRIGRITAYSGAMQEWIADVCELTEEQKQQLAQIAKQELTKSQDSWENGEAKKPNIQLGDTFPVKFTIRYGTAQNLDLTRHYKKLNDVLTEEQKSRLKAATAERRKFHIDAMISRVLNMLDEELFLSQAQREQMIEPLKSRLNGMESSSFSYYRQSYYYDQQSIGFLLQRGDHLKVLNEAQQQRAKDLATLSENNSYNSEQYILFQSNEGTDGWYTKLEESLKEQRNRVQRACAVRSAFYESEWDLADSQSRYLKVAGKGIADRVIAQWKKTVQQQLKSYEEQANGFGGNFSFSMQVVDLKTIEQDELWKHTIKRINPGKGNEVYDRDEYLRQQQAQFLTGLLDKELWLKPEQRERLQSLIADTLPTSGWQNPYRNYMDEVALLVIPLFKFSKTDASLFEGAQKEAWETLKAEFDYNGRYVMVHMKNGGQFHFMIPR